MRKLVFVLLILGALALVGSPALAASSTPVGTRINLITGTPTSLPADTPFHVLHGWGLAPNMTVPGRADFQLDVDGVPVQGQLVNTGAGATGGTLVKLWLYNFDDGLPAGTYTFTGHWFLSCTDAVNGGLFGGPCPLPNAMIEVFTFSLTVTFS